MDIIEEIKAKIEAESAIRLARWEQEARTDAEASVKDEVLGMNWDYVSLHDVG